MGIDLYWDDDAMTTLLCVFDGRWTWDELYATMRTIKNITDDVDYEISAIIDLRKGMQLPGGSLLSAQGLEHARQLLKMGENGTGPIVIVGATHMIRSLYDTMRKLDSRALGNVSFADNVRDARAFLSQRQSQRAV